MENILSFLESIATKDVVNYFVLTSFFFALYIIAKIAINSMRFSAMYKSKSQDNVKPDFSLDEIGYLKSIKNASELYVKFHKKKKKKSSFYFSIVLLSEFAVVAVALYFDKLILGIGLMLIVHYVGVSILKVSARNMDDIIQEELPLIIKHFVKILARTSDIRIVIYETSKTMNEPLKSRFELLSRKMLTDGDEKCLEEFADDLDNIWMYAFTFLILSLKQDSKKDDVIENLKLLAQMLDDGNMNRLKEITERKPMIMMNTIIAVIAIVGGVANVLFNEATSPFFFMTITGMGLFLLGVGAVLATFIINVNLSRRTGGES